MNLPQHKTTNQRSIEATIEGAAKDEEQRLSEHDRANAQAISELTSNDFRISHADYRKLLRYILITIAILGLFLIVASLASGASVVEGVLLSLGIELLAGAGLVHAIDKCLNNDSEQLMILLCLIFGLLLTLIPLFLPQCWLVKLLESIGVELLGGGVLITLFEAFVRKVKSRNP